MSSSATKINKTRKRKIKTMKSSESKRGKKKTDGKKQASIQSFFTPINRKSNDDDDDSISNSEKPQQQKCYNNTPETPPSAVVTSSEVETPPSSTLSSSTIINSPPTTTKKDKREEIYSNNNRNSNCENDDNFIIKKRRKIVGPTKQLYLDLGQKSFGKRITCSLCGMLYVQGIEEDEKQHKLVCQDFQEGVLFKKGAARVVLTKNSIEEIIEIRPSDNFRQLQKLKRVLKIAHNDLGSSSSLSSINNKTTYLYLYKKRIVGMVVAEVISKAYVLEKSYPMRCSDEKQKAMVGIHQIWVHRNHRRKGVASELIDIIRTKFIYGLWIPPNMLAFSSPTQLGNAFARSYIRKNNGEKNDDNTVVLVYDCLYPT